VAYRIILSQSAKRALAATIPAKYVSAIIAFIEGPLADNPRRVGKPLRDDLEGYYSARRGEYRVIYRILDETVEVYIEKLSHRAHAYGQSIAAARRRL
jgi:mRNA-degrading endonuclease RelE of RelBE toxin-antitoxin system